MLRKSFFVPSPSNDSIRVETDVSFYRVMILFSIKDLRLMLQGNLACYKIDVFSRSLVSMMERDEEAMLL